MHTSGIATDGIQTSSTVISTSMRTFLTESPFRGGHAARIYHLAQVDIGALAKSLRI
jgi:hypothetical protein